MKTSSFLTLCLLLTSSLPAAGKEFPCKPEKWQDTIAKFEAADQADPPAKDGILFVGSSSIVLWKLPKAFPSSTPPTAALAVRKSAIRPTTSKRWSSSIIPVSWSFMPATTTSPAAKARTSPSRFSRLPRKALHRTARDAATLRRHQAQPRSLGKSTNHEGRQRLDRRRM